MQDDDDTGNLDREAQQPPESEPCDEQPEGDEPEQPVRPGDVPKFCLPDKYESAKVGMSISVRRKSRWIYSLEKLVNIVRNDHKCLAQVAREKVVRIVYSCERQHGADAPLFMDPLPPRKEKPKSNIITPPWMR